MLRYVSCIFLITLLACGDNGSSAENIKPSGTKNAWNFTTHGPFVQQLIDQNNGCSFDTLRIEDALLNGHKLWIPLSDFEKIEKPDSSRSLDWMCGSPFDWTDPTKGEAWVTHYYCSNREYISNGKEALIYHFDMAGNELGIPSRNTSFNDKTTLDDFQKIFPISFLRGYRTRDDIETQIYDVSFNPIMDDKWCFHFSNDRLVRVELWWLLC